MVESYKFQLQAIKRKLKSMGYEPDLYDLHSHIDRKLSLRENMRIIVSDIKYLAPRKRVQSGGRQSNVARFEQARDIFDKLKPNVQRLDSMKQARTTFEVDELNKKNFKRWKKNTNRFDIMGVDSKY
jgi:hypothetical protein